MIDKIASKESTKMRRGGGVCRLFSALVFSVVFAAATFYAQPRPDFVLENIRAKSGEKATGFVEVPAGVDEGTQIPVSVFHGAKDGKVLLVFAGIHGSEYAPVLALQNLVKRINAKGLSGTIILVHVANPPSFLKRTIYYGADGKNLNRVFPGKADGTITERIAYVLTEKFIRRADYLIDVHSGDNNESLRPYAGYTENDTASPELIETSRRMAFAFGIDFIKIARGRSTDLATAAYTTNAAFLLGKAAIAIESGELGAPQAADIIRVERGLLNVMRELGMLGGKSAKFKNQIVVRRDQTLRSEKTGLFYSAVKRDQRVKAGDLLGFVTDYFGNKLQEVRAPFAGVVLYYTATPPVSASEPLVNVGEIDERASGKK